MRDYKYIGNINTVKGILVVIAIVITIASLWVSNNLIRDLKVEERKKIEIWAEAMRSMSKADENSDMTLVLKVLEENRSIPVVVLDADENILEYRNFSATEITNEYVKSQASLMRNAGREIRIFLSDNSEQVAIQNKEFITICYGESIMLKRLAQYPYVQLGIVALFVLVAIYALLSSKRAEQNKVWVGLSRETAHQLGTPISSISAWTEVLRETYPDDPMLNEMQNDVNRLHLIAERLSKIGSAPEFKEENLCEVIGRVVDYIGRRTSDAVKLNLSLPDTEVMVKMNSPLFEWVIENLCKNAIDAMQGSGSLSLYIYRAAKYVVVEVSDTGKGIAPNNLKNVFKPGFTTKRRGWGLGLSLAKRIVEDYHKGRIYVNRSQLGIGTTFAVELRL